MSKKVSLKDIAQEVGVSTALVSYVLNNLKEGRIRKEVAQKIREVAGKLNYRPNQIARSLKSSKTFTVGLVVADISNPFSSSLARIIEDELHLHNYTVIFGSSDENLEKFIRITETLLNRQVDGLIMSPPAEAGEFLKILSAQGVPIVLVDRFFPEIDMNYVVTDNHEAASLGTTHILESGRSRPAMITYNSSLIHLKEREEGFLSVLKNKGIDKGDQFVRKVDINNKPEEIASALNSLLDLDPRPDALLFGSNMIGSQCLKLMNRMSIKVPEEVSIVCFDEAESLDLFYAPLVYIKQPLQEMGTIATRILIENSSTSGQPKSHIKLRAELVYKAGATHASK